MNALGPTVLDHSWPLWERRGKFELGHLLNCVVSDLPPPGESGELNGRHAGCWECDLSDNSLAWSGGVYDIFGLPRGVSVRREEAVALYTEESRALMERLRAYAIKHKRGFTLDVQIRPAAVGPNRWMRLIAAPEYVGNRAVRLHGLKLII